MNNQPVPAGFAAFNGEIPFEDNLPFAALRQGQFIDLYVWADGSWAWQVRTDATALIAAIEAAGEALTELFRIEVTDGRGGFSTFDFDVNLNDRAVDFSQALLTMAPGSVLDIDSLVFHDYGFDGTNVIEENEVNAVALTIYDPETDSVEGELAIGLGFGSIASYDANTNTLTINGTVAEINAVLDTLTYTNSLAGDSEIINLRDLGPNGSEYTVAQISVENPPAVAPDIALPTIVEDTTLTAGGNVLANDTPGPSGTLSVIRGFGPGSGTNTIAAGGSATLIGIYGTLLLELDGDYIYTLNSATNVQSLTAGQQVADVFQYTMRTGTTDLSTTLTLNITGTAPTVVADVEDTTLVEETTLTAGGNVLGNDAPAGTGTLRVIQGTSPGSGTVGIAAAARRRSSAPTARCCWNWTATTSTRSTARRPTCRA